VYLHVPRKTLIPIVRLQLRYQNSRDIYLSYWESRSSGTSKFGDIIRIARVVFGPAVDMVLSSHISYDTIAVWPGLLVL